MEIYLVRHGQTDGNLAKRHQAETSPLTRKGRQQAKDAALKIAEIKPTHLISSTHIRALETARIISDEVSLDIETSPLLIELHRPKNIYGYHHLSLKSLFYILKWSFNRVGSTVYSDEGESYTSIRERVLKTRDYLETLPEDARVIVVSHVVFISLFSLHLCHDKPLSPLQIFKHWFKIRVIKNTSINHFTFGKSNEDCGWRINK